MKIALISSTIDPASVNIRQHLLEGFDFKETEEHYDENTIFSKTINDKEIKLYTINDFLIYSNDIDEKIEADVFIFLSKHRAEGGRASLTVHPIGNFAEANVGGYSGKLCNCPTNFLKDILVSLTKTVEETRYEATLEATHHGPYIKKPILFLELGSAEEHWEDSEGGNLISKALMDALSKETKEYEATIVLGGLHYSHVANKFMLQSDIAVSHMMPKYNFDKLNKEMLMQMIDTTIPKPTWVLLDWKGLGKEKEKVKAVLEEAGIEYKRSDQYFKS